MTAPMADTREYLVVHQCLRVTLDRFVDTTARLDPAHLALVLGSRWALFARALHHHHEVEDADFFPLVKRTLPETSAMIDRLASEHVDLVARLDAVDAAVIALELNPSDSTKQIVHDCIKAVRDELVPHLDVEDADLLPRRGHCDQRRRVEGDGREGAFRSVPKKDLPVVAGVMDEIVAHTAGRTPPTAAHRCSCGVPHRRVVAQALRQVHRTASCLTPIVGEGEPERLPAEREARARAAPGRAGR